MYVSIRQTKARHRTSSWGLLLKTHPSKQRLQSLNDRISPAQAFVWLSTCTQKQTNINTRDPRSQASTHQNQQHRRGVTRQIHLVVFVFTKLKWKYFYLGAGLVRNGLKWRGFLRAAGLCLLHRCCEGPRCRSRSSEKPGGSDHNVVGLKK